jgi:hypothetical protein
MSTQYTTPFREFITRDDQGRYHVRLGPQTFSTNYKLTDIRLETENGGTPVDPEYLKAKPWILRNLQQEVDKQRKRTQSNVCERLLSTHAIQQKSTYCLPQFKLK